MKIPKIEFQDSTVIVVNKPSGFLTHASELERNAPILAHWLNDNVGQTWQPAHRLDRATEGLVLFTREKKHIQRLMQDFMHGDIEKHYHALVRGWMSESEGHFGYARPFSLTRWHLIHHFRSPHPVDKYPEARYSEVRLSPHTGRMHQLRIHLARASHPILGDTRYGHGPHNRFARDTLGINTLCLHATELSFIHPVTGKRHRVYSSNRHPWSDSFQ